MDAPILTVVYRCPDCGRTIKVDVRAAAPLCYNHHCGKVVEMALDRAKTKRGKTL
jgi:DNA-directed RNA polymerase subunit RPC12/RpoP